MQLNAKKKVCLWVSPRKKANKNDEVAANEDKTEYPWVTLPSDCTGDAQLACTRSIVHSSLNGMKKSFGW